MKYAALLSNGKVVTGSHHGDAFSKLSVEEQNGEVESGFYDPVTGVFCGEDQVKFIKQMYLIRHGESHPNHLDGEISPLGRLQANRTAEYLSQFDLSEFKGYVSPYQRCLQTADIIGDKTGITFEVVVEVREKACQSECVPSRKMDYPQFDWPNSPNWNFKPEQQLEFRDRLQAALQEIASKVVVVSHCDFILNLTQMLVDSLPEKTSLPGGSVTIIECQKLVCLGRECSV